MDPNALLARLEQLAAASQSGADAMASLQTEAGAIRARLAGMEAEAAEQRQAQLRLSEQVERLSAEAERRAGDTSLSAQVEALRAAQAKAADRGEQLHGELRRIDQLQVGMSQLGRELTADIEQRERQLRTELQAHARQRTEEGERTLQAIQALGGLGPRLDALAAQSEALGRRQVEFQGFLDGFTRRMDGLTQLAGQVEEADKRREVHVQSEVTGLREAVRLMDERLAEMRQQIEAQTIVVRDARTLAAEVRAAAERLGVDHHATLESARLTQERMEQAIAALRQEFVDQAGAQAEQRRQEAELMTREQAGQQRLVREEIRGQVTSLEAEIALLREGVEAGLELGRKDLDDLRLRLARFVRSLGDVVTTSGQALDVAMPSGDPALLAPERRQALRRALRARRAAGGGP